MAYEDLTPEEMITKARVDIRRDKKVAPLAFLLSMFNTLYSNKVRTVAITNNMEILINKSFFMQLTVENRKYYLLHVLTHYFLKHLKRWKDIPSQLLKIAEDMKVAQILSEGGYLPEYQKVSYNGKESQLQIISPMEGHYKFRYKNHLINTADKSVDEVYDMLVKLLEKDPPDKDNCQQDQDSNGSGDNDNQGNGEGSGNGNNDQNDSDDKSPEDQDGYMSDSHLDNNQEVQQEAQSEQSQRPRSDGELDRLIQTVGDMFGKEKGFNSADLMKYIDQLFDTRIDYRYALMKYIQPLIAIGQTWSKPNKKIMASTDIYMPGKVKGGEISIMCAIDTSGSIGEEEYRLQLSEIKGLLTQFEQVRVTLLVGDTRLKHKCEIDSNTDIAKIPYVGGGGTSHRFVYEQMIEHNPVCCIMFTDGYSDIEQCELRFADLLSTDRMFVLTEPAYKERLSKYGQTWDLISEK